VEIQIKFFVLPDCSPKTDYCIGGLQAIPRGCKDKGDDFCAGGQNKRPFDNLFFFVMKTAVSSLSFPFSHWEFDTPIFDIRYLKMKCNIFLREKRHLHRLFGDVIRQCK
jgi:hypothetical protein